MRFTRSLAGFRRVPTHHGDTLQKIAAREMGDAALWYRLIYLNGLTAPYITDDPATAGDDVLLTGQTILLPASGGAAIRAHDPHNIYGDDIHLAGGRIGVAHGDMAVTHGVANLSQALTHRVQTEQGELRFHLGYGCAVRQMIGQQNTANSVAAAGFVKRAVRADYRVRRVADASASIRGDAIRVDATAEAVTGEQIGVRL